MAWRASSVTVVVGDLLAKGRFVVGPKTEGDGDTCRPARCLNSLRVKQQTNSTAELWQNWLARFQLALHICKGKYCKKKSYGQEMFKLCFKPLRRQFFSE